MSAPLKIPIKDIESVTDNFADANFIGEGFLGKIYKGRLPDPESGELIDVSVRRLDYSFWLQEMAFDKEISILSRLKHENMVSNVGFCYENNEMLIINKHVAHGSLRMHLSGPTLDWTRRLQISIGVVRALSYLHNDVGRNLSVFHHNINSSSILLDENWEAKISGFEYSLTIPARHQDLAYEKLGIGTYMSDVFSVGIVLFELLCGTEAFVSKDDNNFQVSLAIFHYENGKLHKLVDPDLFRQMDQQSFTVFSKTAYNCLINRRSPPNMKEVLKRLEKALTFQQMHENNEQSTLAVERTIPNHLKLKLKNLEYMRIRLADILLATEKFASKYCIASGGFGSVYTAELEHVDKGYRLAVDSENKPDVPKTRNKVAIKRIIDTGEEIEERGFYAEIEMLTSCKQSNIINLLGFCDEGPAMILIYEYASNGSLNHYFFSKHRKINNDSWAQRVKICLDAAKGLSFLHTADGDRNEIVHRDIKSANILLDANFEAKIGDFGLSVFPSLSYEHNTRFFRSIAGTPGYMDPQYSRDANLKTQSDIYSFGVVLFEILFGTLSYDPKYTEENGLALVARQHFDKGTIKEMVDPKIREKVIKTIFSSVKGPCQESLDTFSKIAYQCLEEAQAKRPKMEVVVKELEKALFFQENRKDILRVKLKDIQLATDNFRQQYHRDDVIFNNWTTYRGIVSGGHEYATSIDVDRFLEGSHKHDKIMMVYEAELKVLMKYKHENMIALLGYCEEGEERIVVYEHASNGSLDRHLLDANLTWGKRLKICIDIASGLDFLHGGLVTGEVVIHGDIRSQHILLDGDMNAKLFRFGRSVMHPIDQDLVSHGPIFASNSYIDPYVETNMLSKECDIYSFGIVLFEILLKRLARTEDFMMEREGDYLGPVMKRLYKEGKLDAMMFEGANEPVVPQSVTIFRRIAIQCLHENREQRPTAGEIIIQLKQALEIQEKGMDIVKISFEDIKNATDNFSNENLIGRGGYARMFKGQLRCGADGLKIIVAKLFDREYGQGDTEFYQELEILFKFKHQNVIGLQGYCDETTEKIIVYEYPANGSLHDWLKNNDLTWLKRLEICIDVATGLDFLHGDVSIRQEGVIHRNITTSSILISENWKAKITDFGLSLISTNNQEIDYVKMETSAECYIDPTYKETGIISKASDIYSFGVVLFELLCGRSAYETSGYTNNQQYLGPLAKKYYEEKKLDELVFGGIKEHIVPQSLSIYAKIAYKCLHDDQHQRPTTSEVVAQLNEAKDFHVDCEMWESSLPIDYKEIIQQSETPEICYTKKKKDLYDMLREGIFIQKHKVWLWLDINNNKNEMISPTLFRYKNQSSQKWRRIRKARFERVSLMMEVSNLNIQIKIKANFLTRGATYGVYLVFKLGESNKTSSKPMYVNLKYKREDKTLHAYYATWREDEWMMIELYRFLNHKDGGDFEVLLESFSRYYCRSGTIYIEGIEFRAIDNAKHDEEIGESRDVQQTLRSNSNMVQMQQFPADKQGAKRSKMNGRKPYMLSAKEVLYDHSNMKLHTLKPSERSRFATVIEVLSQQVIRIKCEIRGRKLPSHTDYGCYMIFKLSEKCRGLYCPVKIRGLLHTTNKVSKVVYFRSPNPWNIHDSNQVPRQREDRWMEIDVWKFNSKNAEDTIHVNLKLISYEGTMSGLVVSGLEFRPM